MQIRQERKCVVHWLVMFSVVSVISVQVFVSTSLSAKPLDALTREIVVEELSYLFEDSYVDAKVGRKSADYILQQLASDRYSNIIDNAEFARQLTVDLQSINHDKHVRVFAPQFTGPTEANGKEENQQQALSQTEVEDNYGFREAKVLPGNIGYLDFRYFSGEQAAGKTAAAALKQLEDTDAIIFDMRQNGGGNPHMVRFICSYFFTKKTHLNSLYWRMGDRTEEFWTLDKVPGKKRPDIPVFILTSKKTFSGAEEFAYNFQTQKRGIVVGETTGGGANPGGRFPVSAGYSVFVPTGKAINPVTDTNWEGVGVKPDVEIDSDLALDKALELARLHINEKLVRH